MNTIPLEIKLKNNKEPLYYSPINDPIELVKIKNKFQKGTLAMVKVNKRESSSTEYFISFNKSPELDGRYSIFGKVVDGYEILNLLQEGDLLKTIQIYE